MTPQQAKHVALGLINSWEDVWEATAHIQGIYRRHYNTRGWIPFSVAARVARHAAGKRNLDGGLSLQDDRWYLQITRMDRGRVIRKALTLIDMPIK